MGAESANYFGAVGYVGLAYAARLLGVAPSAARQCICDRGRGADAALAEHTGPGILQAADTAYRGAKTQMSKHSTDPLIAHCDDSGGTHPGDVLRSLVFYPVFYGGTVYYVLAAMLAGWLKPRYVGEICSRWAAFHRRCAKHILRIRVRHEGV